MLRRGILKLARPIARERKRANFNSLYSVHVRAPFLRREIHTRSLLWSNDKPDEDLKSEFLGGQHQPRYKEADSSADDPAEQARLDQKLTISFTCTVTDCGHRSTKQMSRRSYEKGVVLITCDGCKNHHLIADNLGWFDDEKVNIEDIMREKGMEVQKFGSIDALEFAGASIPEKSSEDEKS